MKKRKVYIAIFIISVLGLAFIQYRYLEIGLNLAKIQFNRKIAQTTQDIKEDLSQKDQLTFLVGKAITQDASFFRLGLDSVQDASSHYLNDFITERLVKNGIETDFSYSLVAQDSTDYLTSPKVFRESEKLNRYPIELDGYLPLLLNKRLILELQFKDINTYFLFQLNGLTIPSLIFILAIIAVVIWVLRSFYWQRNVITTTNEFVNNLTHELKTPVFAIGLATKILEEDISEKKKPIVAIIKHELERLNGHIDKVLELGSLESRKNVFQLTKIDLLPILQNICEEFSALTTLEGITFSYSLEGGPYLLKGEISHLENAINNLLDNARKYSDGAEIRLTAYTCDNKLVIVVSDKGKGISKKDQKRIFQKYYRVTNGNLYKVKGYGLGLSYVKRVIDGHKAKIKLESELEKGTTMTIMIPLLKR